MVATEHYSAITTNVQLVHCVLIIQQGWKFVENLRIHSVKDSPEQRIYLDSHQIC